MQRHCVQREENTLDVDDMLKHERRQVNNAVLAGQSSYFSMVWIHAVAVPSIRAIAWSHCVERDKYILDVDDGLNAVLIRAWPPGGGAALTPGIRDVKKSRLLEMRSASSAICGGGPPHPQNVTQDHALPR